MKESRIFLKTPRGEEISAIKAFPGCFCAGCFEPINTNDPMAVCCDCGAMFCKNCVENGTFDAHTCDEENCD